MNALLVLPLIIPLVTAALAIMVPDRLTLQRVLGVGGAAVLFIAALALLRGVEAGGVHAVQIGDWPAPFGITLVADTFSAIMVAIAGFMGLAVIIFSTAEVDVRRQQHGFFPLVHIMLMGVCGAFLTGDVFNLYVWFEVMLISSFVLLAFGGGRPQMEGAFKYFTLNLLGSIIFLSGVGLLYATMQTLNMADLNAKMAVMHGTHPHLIHAIAGLFMVAFGIKAAVFPLFFWLPASYHTPPVSIAALFAALQTKVGVYVLIRFFTLIFPEMPLIYTILLVTAGFTMVCGVLGAFAQYEFRRLLSFHIISQIGYMVMGLGLLVSPNPEARALGIAAAIFYIVHNILAKTNLFLISGTVRQMRGTYDLKRLGGVLHAAPWLAILFLISALALAGVPPLSGFWAKLSIIQAGLLAEAWWIVAAALFTGLLTLMSMIKIWNEAFWKPAPPAAEEDDHAWEPMSDSNPAGPLTRGRLAALVGPIVIIAGVILYVGLNPQHLLSLSRQASRQMLNPGEYISAVQPHTVEQATRNISRLPKAEEPEEPRP